jgi:ATP/maltotriose-dependent transcriptional regulator MalT
MLSTEHTSGEGAASRSLDDPGHHPFEIPAPPRRYVGRGRLERQLDEGQDLPLTLVSAPAGSGKTALVAAWAAARTAREVAWVASEAGDEGSERFWPLVTEALRRGGLSVTHRRGDERLDTTRQVLTSLGMALANLPRRITLVLDGFEVADPALASELDFVMSHSGRRLRVVMLTRADPMLPLHRFRLEEAITELRMADLAFTEDETAQLLTCLGIRLAGTSVCTLLRRTRGRAAELTAAGTLLARSHDPEQAVARLSEGSGNVVEQAMALSPSDPLASAPRSPARSRAIEIPPLTTFGAQYGEPVIWEAQAHRTSPHGTTVLEGGEILEPLTAKEREVLQHLSELLTTQEIADAMFISVNTVRTHVRSILRKLAVSRRNEAVRRGRAMSLVPG